MAAWDEDEFEDDDLDDDEDEDDEGALAEELEAGVDDDLRGYQPHVGTSTDPFEDRPEARRQALKPLLTLEGQEGALAASSLRVLYGTGTERIDALLALHDPQRVVQALPADEFVLLIKEIGLNDAGDILSLASPRQLQAAIDLDAWEDSALDQQLFGEWMQVAIEAGPKVATRFLQAQEDGVLTLYLSRSLRVVEREEEPDPPVPDDMEIFPSPDGMLQLVADPDDAELPSVRAMVTLLYRESAARARTILRALRWELPSQLEEDFFRLRNARLEDLGFLERDEARQMYEYTDPQSAREALRQTWRGTGPVEAGTLRPYLPDLPRVGLALRDALDAPFLPKVLGLLPEADRERVRLSLVRLAYRAQAARAEKPSAVEELPLWSKHAVHTLEMALEYVSEGDAQYAALLLNVVPGSELFRLGHALVLVEFHRARRLRTALGGDAGVGLLATDDAALVRGMCRSFPGIPTPEGGVRPIASLEQLATVRARLQGIQATARLIEELTGVTVPEVIRQLGPNHPDLSLAAIIATALARHALGLPPPMVALSQAELQAFLRKALIGGKIRADLRQAVVAAVLARPDLGDDEAAGLARTIEAALDDVGESLGGLDPERAFDLRFIGHSILVQNI
jgi:hypothetical protein